MTQAMSQKMSNEPQNNLPSAEEAAQNQSPETTEKMSIPKDEKMSIPKDEKMSIPEDEKMSIPPQNEEQIDILCDSLTVPEKMSIPSVENECIDTFPAHEVMQDDNLFVGEIDPTQLDDHGYAIRKVDGTFVDAMCSAAEFDALLEDLGFLLLDRVNWPLYHRMLVLQQAPRGKGGIYLVERKTA